MHHGNFHFNIEIRADGSVRTPGVNFGGHVVLVHRQGRYAVLRVPSGSHWAGIGSRSSHGSKWMLVKVVHETTPAARSLTGRAFTRDVATIVDEAEPGTKWHATRNRMVGLCELASCPCGGFVHDGAFVHAETCDRAAR